MNGRFHSYRGIVVYNEDPQLKGRVKIYVPGIYPIQFKDQWQKLPWAEPALALGGGNWANQKHTEVEDSVLKLQGEQLEAVTNNQLAETDTQSQEQQEQQQQEQQEEQKQQITHQKAAQLNAETGWCTVPHAGKYATDGSQVWVFFEAGDINKPIYFASVQSGSGWFSQHPNQHVFHSDNIRVRIDENPYRQQSTCFFPTYNTNIVKSSLQESGGGAPGGIPFMKLGDLPGTVNNCGWQTPLVQVKDKKAKLDIEILETHAPTSGDLAVHIKVTGHVNIQISGDIYLQHTGNKIETHVGDHYLHHVGNTTIFREGNINYNHIGNILHNQTGNIESNLTGNQLTVIQGNLIRQRTGNQQIFTKGDIIDTLDGNKTEKITQTQTRTVLGAVTQTFANTFTKTVQAASTFTYTVIDWTLEKLFFK